MLTYPEWLHPVIITIGFLNIRWYGLMYLVGFFLCYSITPRLAKKRGIRLSQSSWDNVWLLFILSVIGGGRLGHILLGGDGWYFIQNPLKIFAIWEGGMAFQGALITCVLAAFFFSKKHRINFLDLTDIFIFPLSLALALGRLGNFANAELYGKITNVPWAMKFPTAEGYRHPTQIYKFLKNLFIFFVMLGSFRWTHKLRGFFTMLFFILYGSIRFFIDFLGAWEATKIGDLFLSQWLCIVMVIVGFGIMIMQWKVWKRALRKKR